MIKSVKCELCDKNMEMSDVVSGEGNERILGFFCEHVNITLTLEV